MGGENTICVMSFAHWGTLLLNVEFRIPFHQCPSPMSSSQWETMGVRSTSVFGCVLSDCMCLDVFGCVWMRLYVFVWKVAQVEALVHPGVSTYFKSQWVMDFA